jgi:L-alanine-DL-glutamate epimerase-like enolase superfamily enzyme
MRARTSVHDVPLTDPLRPAAGSPLLRPLIVLRLQAADGTVGYGEAAPLEEYNGVSVSRVLDALTAHMSILGTNECQEVDMWAACAAEDPLPQALAAVDMALWDLAGHRAGRSVSELLGLRDPPPVAVNATIGAVAPRDAALEARRAQADGFTSIKVKVGTPDDRQRLQAIRGAVGPKTLIRVDANGAWDRLTAPERIRALARFDIELFEEPVHGNEAVEAVARVVPNSALALDESASAEFGTFARRFCDAVCLKIASSGGISGLLSDAEAARQAGYEVYVASTLDGPLGIAAALHAAAVLRADRHCGLATLGRFDRAVPAALVPERGVMRVPAGAGLGDGLIGWYVE